jgi:thioredoxin 1
MANLFEITSDTFQSEVLESDKPVLVDFSAVWCQPCKMLDPVVEELAGEYGQQVKFVKVDADHNSDIVMDYNIMSVPTLLLFKGGQVAERMTGYKPKKAILDKFEPHFA